MAPTVTAAVVTVAAVTAAVAAVTAVTAAIVIAVAILASVAVTTATVLWRLQVSARLSSLPLAVKSKT